MTVEEPGPSGHASESSLLDWGALDTTHSGESSARPADSSTPPGGGRRPWGRALKVLSAAVVLALAAGGVAMAATSSGPRYRTATARLGDVDQDLTGTGVLSPVSTARVAFPVSGRVTSVAVQVGQRVKAGQPLASLDATSLRASLDQVRSTLATAQAKLAADLAAQASGSSAPSAGGDTTTALVLRRPSMVLVAVRTTGASSSNLQADQQQLLAAQHVADVALQSAQGDLAAARTACRSVSSGISTAAYAVQTPGPSASPSPSSGSGGASGSGSTGGSGGSGGAGSGSSGALSACSAALDQTLGAESLVSADQQKVQTAARALDAAVSAVLAERPSGTPGPTTPSGGGRSGTSRSGAGNSRSNGTGTGTGTAPSSGAARARNSGPTGSATHSTGGGATRSSGGPVTAAQISADQADVDSDQARVQTAQLSLAQATLVSPLTGTVGSVAVTAGSTVSGGSPTPAFVVLGPGGDQAVVDIPATDIDSVQQGQGADVVPDGQTTPVPGTVVGIGLLPVSGTTSSGTTSPGTPSYPVTIALGDAGHGPFAGSGAGVTVHVATAKQVLTVPTSAVRTLGANHFVTVLRDGKATATGIVIGAVGADRTQVASGLRAGDEVVLATMSTPLPTSSTSVRGLTGGGGFGGTRSRTGGS